MMFIGPFRMSSLLNYHGMNQWLKVCCKVCTTIESKEIILATKLDSLYKHVGRKKAKANHLGMAEGTIFIIIRILCTKKMKPYMLLIFIAIVFINWIWGRLGRTKIKRSSLLLCFIC